MNYYYIIGTHDIQEIQVDLMQNSICVTVDYTMCSRAAGALLNFVLTSNNNGSVSFTQSIFLALNRSIHPLPFELLPGHYRVFAFNIESDGTLTSGVGYPAVSREIFARDNVQGTQSLVKDRIN